MSDDLSAETEMPQRFLRPGITTSLRFNSVPWMAQSLYMRLVTLVDDFGRYDAEPRLICSHAFPLGDPEGQAIPVTMIERLCRSLSEHDLVIFYIKDGKKYLQIARWNEKPRADQSKFPPFDGTCTQMFTESREILLPSSSSSPSSSDIAIASTQLRWSKAKGWEGVTDDMITEMKAAYPACDIRRQFLDMEQWLKANPAKAHKSNWRRFADNWLRRQQQSGGDLRNSSRSRNSAAITDRREKIKLPITVR